MQRLRSRLRLRLRESEPLPLVPVARTREAQRDPSASLVGRPSILFLDEPTTGLDPRSRLQMWDVIADLVADGTTVLLTTSYLEVVVRPGPSLDDAAQSQRGFSDGEASVDLDSRRVTAPVSGGSTLAGVFLRLTGHGAQDAPAEPATTGRGRGRKGA